MSSPITVTLTGKEVETIQLLLVLAVNQLRKANDEKPNPKLSKTVEEMIDLSFKIEPKNNLWDVPIGKYLDIRYQFPGSPRQ